MSKAYCRRVRLTLSPSLSDDRQGRGHKGSRKKGGVKRKKRAADGEVGGGEQEGASPEVEIDRELDRELENKSRQHNLTTVNVRNIIHEVITNEHVVAMMKAAINETEAVPVFVSVNHCISMSK
uniref:Uncharacterized protein n=1 Tax=Hucho hucho TaxID=62062 RepID=A0A4W5R8Q4_9TELE